MLTRSNTPIVLELNAILVRLKLLDRQDVGKGRHITLLVRTLSGSQHVRNYQLLEWFLAS